jgi:hypothetical protein
MRHVCRYNILFLGWTTQGSSPGGDEIFRTHPNWPWCPHSSLYNWYWVYFPVVKQPGHGVNHQPPSSVVVKERVEQYLYSLSLSLSL